MSVLPEAVVSKVCDVADVALGGDGIFQVFFILGAFGRVLLVNACNHLIGKKNGLISFLQRTLLVMKVGCQKFCNLALHIAYY